ncbi:MAG: hypothetical protein ACXAE3_02190 [Candidatus Kariarchaeaceae archaeon]|jgi:hypothetical protein
MKFYRIIGVFFLSSLLLLLPLLSTSYEVKLFPFEEENIVVNIKSPTVDLSTEIGAGVDIAIYYLDPNTDDLENYINVSLFGEETVNFDKRGNYLFILFTQFLGDVIIDQRGISPTTPLIIIIMGIINFAYRFYLRYMNAVMY